MSRYGWAISTGWFVGHFVGSTGCTYIWSLDGSLSVRPDFYNLKQRLYILRKGLLTLLFFYYLEVIYYYLFLLKVKNKNYNINR